MNQEKETTIKEEEDSLKIDDDIFNEDLGVGGDLGLGDMSSTGEKYSELLKELTNFNKYIKTKINGWLGLVWNEEKSRYVRDKDLDPIMNRRCAMWCIDFLKTYTRGNNIITDISKDEYNYLYQDIGSVVWVDLGTKTEEFGIKNNQDLHKIGTELIHSALLVLMGAGDGKYNKLLSSVTQRTESVSLQPQGQEQQATRRPGFLSRMGRMLGG